MRLPVALDAVGRRKHAAFVRRGGNLNADAAARRNNALADPPARRISSDRHGLDASLATAGD